MNSSTTIEKKRINATQPYLPSRGKLEHYIDTIYHNNYLTNNGPLLTSLTSKLEEYLQIKNLLLVSSGTFALQLAYKLLGLKGEVITTPFSFCATTSSLLWHDLTPRFIDIERDTFNIDARLIEQQITSNTSAILPVHVFGNPSKTGEIQEIASAHGLKIIYDAAHCFGTTLNDNSILYQGDISIISFHATKVFHTVEGGGLVIKDDALFEQAKKLINFGLDSNSHIAEVGVNGKMSEFHAAMGLCLLDDIDKIINERKRKVALYQDLLKDYVSVQKWEGEQQPYAYCPVLFDSQKQCLNVIDKLNYHNIYPKRYFHPALNSVHSFASGSQANCPVTEDITERILCLPLYVSLEDSVIEYICKLIKTELY